jgi:type IV pilus assembly protein PilV
MNTHSTRGNTPRNRQHGLSLIELLVAVVVLSLGALGVAGLQANALKGGEASSKRTQAVIAANAMLDLLRAQNSLNPNTLAQDTGLVCTGSGTPPGDEKPKTNTTERWIDDLKDAIGDVGSTCGQINCAAAAGGTLCTITIQWDDTRSGSGNRAIDDSGQLALSTML